MPRLKSWESPRRQGRNDKGKGGSARRRQLKKQRQMFHHQLKTQSKGEITPYFFVCQVGAYHHCTTDKKGIISIYVKSKYENQLGQNDGQKLVHT